MSRLTFVMNLPKQFTFVFVALIVFCTVGSVYAEETGGPGGRWPKSWPKELEPLREQASTWQFDSLTTDEGCMSYEIPFANREEFESAWPHILKLKGKGAPITLLRGPHIRVRPANKTAGVCIRSPFLYSKELRVPVPLGTETRIELEVDGSIVDLNRIRLPADTPIIDERFKENGEQKKRDPQNAAEQDGAGPPAATTTTTPEGRSSSALDVSDANYVVEPYATYSQPGLEVARHMAFDGSSNLYVTHTYSSNMWRIRPTESPASSSPASSPRVWNGAAGRCWETTCTCSIAARVTAPSSG